MKTLKYFLTLAAVAFTLPFGLPEGEVANVPIIMYHAIEKAPSNRWEITKEEFEGDLAYLANNGYTTVVMQDLIDFVHHGRALPEKPIVLTFDDGRYPTIEIMAELLEKYNSVATMSIIGLQTDKYTKIVKESNPKTYPHMTWGDVKKAAQTGRIEFGCHTFDLHGARGAGKLKGEGEEAYKTRLLNDLEKFAAGLKDNAALTANYLAYPLGVISKESDAIIKEAGYLASLSCYEKNNTITVGDKDGLFSLNRFLRPPRVEPARFFESLPL